MANYKIQFKQSVTKDLRALPKNDIKRILQRIEQLAQDPRAEGCIKLTGQALYRVRVGVYRVLYQILDDVLVVNVITVSHRSDVYKAH